MDRRQVGLTVGAACIAIIGLGSPAARASGPRPAEPRAALAGRTHQKPETFIVLLRLRQDLFLRWKDTGKWPDDKEANAALAGHGEYWARQRQEGRAILAGGMKGDYWDNVALIIFQAESEDEARAIVKADPAVKAYVFQAQVRPFDVSYVTDQSGRKP